MALVIALAGCGVPHDPEQTLARIRQRGEVRAGVTEAPPWMYRSSVEENAEAEGVEATLIRELAAKHGVAVRWYWGNVEEHYAALEGFDLDLVAGGLTDRTPWKKRVGMTRPYVRTRMNVGFRPGEALVRNLRGLSVAVKPATDAITLLQKQKATPVIADDPFATTLPVAAPEWELRARGYMFGDQPLHESRHVMAVPPGENGWLVEVEEHLLPLKPRVHSMLEEAAQK